MGRPKIRDEKKKVTLSVSLTPEANTLLARAENRSRAIDTAIRVCTQVQRLVDELVDGKLKPAAFVEEVRDHVAAWRGEVEEAVSLDALKAEIAKRAALEAAVESVATVKIKAPSKARVAAKRAG